MGQEAIEQARLDQMVQTPKDTNQSQEAVRKQINKNLQSTEFFGL